MGIESNKNFYKTVFALVLPMALQNLINVGISSADVMMLGKVSETVLSGSSLAGQVQFIMTLIFFGITSGAAVLTAQYWGKGDTRAIERVMGIAMRIALCVSILFTVVVLIMPERIMYIFTPEPEVVAEGVKYLKIIAFTYIPMAFTMVYLNIMRSVERVIIATVVYLSSFIVNVILNAILIFGLCGMPKLGIQGAAIATLCARILEFIIVAVYCKRNTVIHFHIKDIFVREKVLMKDFLQYALPVVFNELMWGAACSMNSVIIGHIGSSVVAANSVVQVARQLAMIIAFGIANAAAIIIGKKIGEKNQVEAERDGRRFVILSTLAGVLGSIVILVVRPILLEVLTLSELAQGYLSMMMFVMSYFVIAQSVNTTMVVGIFRAGGDTRFGLVLDVATMWGGSLILGSIAAFVFKWPVTIVYMFIMCDEIIKIPFAIYRYKSKKWLRNVTREEIA